MIVRNPVPFTQDRIMQIGLNHLFSPLYFPVGLSLSLYSKTVRLPLTLDLNALMVLFTRARINTCHTIYMHVSRLFLLRMCTAEGESPVSSGATHR